MKRGARSKISPRQHFFTCSSFVLINGIRALEKRKKRKGERKWALLSGQRMALGARLKLVTQPDGRAGQGEKKKQRCLCCPQDETVAPEAVRKRMQHRWVLLLPRHFVPTERATRLFGCDSLEQQGQGRQGSVQRWRCCCRTSAPQHAHQRPATLPLPCP